MPALTQAAKERLAETALLAEQMLDQVRELSLSLRPSLLDDLGLAPTLRWYLGRVSARLNVDVAFEALGLETRLPGDVETTLYRVVQEAMTNVARHADASEVSVRIERLDGRVLTIVGDDGCGFDPRQLDQASPPSGTGLLGMRERVTLMGGTFDVRSRLGEGTTLLIELPL
jgi:signal transduction histidine kinase